MRHFRIVYEKKDVREVWVDIDESVLSDDDIVNDHTASQIFWDDFDKYDEESDECSHADCSTEILTIDEINEDGEDI